MPPYFRPSTALLNCDKEILRWPGPFDTGFLSPQPPGVAGIGSIAVQIIPTGPTRVGPFSFSGTRYTAVRNCGDQKSLACHANPNPMRISSDNP